MQFKMYMYYNALTITHKYQLHYVCNLVPNKNHANYYNTKLYVRPFYSHVDIT